ncbi:MAG: Ig-like domain-containing protein, partial [Anaerolineae bacterium]
NRIVLAPGAMMAHDVTLTRQAVLDGYQFERGFIVPPNVTLTIEPGITVKEDQADFIVQGHLEAVGTATQPITFTSVADTAPGWDGLLFDGGTGNLRHFTVRCAGHNNTAGFGAGITARNVLTGQVRLESGQIRDVCHWHGSSESGLVVADSRVVVSDTLFTGIGDLHDTQNDAGLYITGAGSTVILQNSTIAENKVDGVHMSGGQVTMTQVSLVRNGRYGVLVDGDTAALRMTRSGVMLNGVDGVRNTGAAQVILGGAPGAGNDILANTGLGVNQVGTGGVITATYNWWGDPTGPYHPTLNPGGKGNRVSDRVLFDPWATDWSGNTAHEVQVRVAGSLRVSPGATTDYAVSYISTLTETVRNAVLVVNLPATGSYVDSTGGGIYWPSRHQVFWKLGDLPGGGFGAVSVRVQFQWGIPEGTREGIPATLVGTNFSQPLLNVDDYLDYISEMVEERTTLTPEQFDAVRQASPDLNKLYNEVVASGFVSGTFESLRLSSGRVVTQAVLIRSSFVQLDVALVFQESDQAMAVIANRTSMVLATASERITLTLPEYDPGAHYPVAPVQGSSAVLISSSFSSWDCLWNCAVEKVGFALLGQFVSVIGKMRQTQKCVEWMATGDPTALVGCLRVVPGANVFIEALKCYNQYRTNPDFCRCKEDKFECRQIKVFGLIDIGVGGVWRTPCNSSTGIYASSQAEMAWYCPFCTVCVGGTGGSAMDRCRPCGKDPCPPGMSPASLVASSISQSEGSGGSDCKKTCIFRPRDPNAKYGPEGDLVPGQWVTYTVTYENEGAGRAYGVYVTDPLSEHFDPSTLTIYGNGLYAASTRTIIWFIGELAPRGEPGSQGVVSFTVRLKSNLPGGTPIINQATVYFPSAPEETPTNAVVNVVQPVAAVPRRVETTYMRPVTIPLEGLDVGGAPLTFTIAALPLYGTLTQMGDTAVYTPMANFVGVDDFSFRASNGITESRPAEVQITVHPQGDTTPPQVQWTWPESGTVDVVPIATPVYSDDVGPLFPPFAIIQFSEPLTAATVNTGTIRMVAEDGAPVPVRVTYDGTMREATVALRQPLRPMKGYTVTVTTGVRDMAGNALASDYRWSFRTGAIWSRVYLPLILRNW